MVKIPIEDDVKKALFSISGVKSPSSDGYIALFYQNQWPNIKDSLLLFISNCFDGSLLVEAVNNTLLSLILKVANPANITQFRPIGLCNVNYKILTKIIVHRIQAYILDLIGEEQLSFVPGRKITNNIVAI